MRILHSVQAGCWVVPIMGTRHKGQPGLFTGRWRQKTFGHPYEMEIQFGADGPFQWYKMSALRYATDDEIPEGVG